MARDMAQGLSAYRMTTGKHVSGRDIVEIFDSGPDVIPVTVETQREFFQDWLASDKSR